MTIVKDNWVGSVNIYPLLRWQEEFKSTITNPFQDPVKYIGMLQRTAINIDWDCDWMEN